MPDANTDAGGGHLEGPEETAGAPGGAKTGRTALRAFAQGRLFGASYGDGQPWVLALHGWRRSHADFDGVLGVLGSSVGHPSEVDDPNERAIDAIALDLPGFGAAAPPPGPWGSSDYAEAVSPVLAEMRRPAVVVGHSFGGGVALNLAVERPDDVAALILSGVPRLVVIPGTRKRPAFRFRVARSLHRIGLVGNPTMERLRYRYGSDDYRVATGVMRQVFVRVLDEDYRPLLAALDCPLELVWGDDDTAAPLQVAEEAAALARNCRLTVCKGGGHLTPLTAPMDLRAAIERHGP